MEVDISKIPKGIYCYDEKLKTCPYWEMQRMGEVYCKYLKAFDYSRWNGSEEDFGYQKWLVTLDAPSILWDQCKECDVNTEEDFEPKDT